MSIHEVITGRDGQEVDRRPFTEIKRRVLKVKIDKGSRKFFTGLITKTEAITAFESIRRTKAVAGRIVQEDVYIKEQIRPEDFCLPRSIGDLLTGHHKHLEYVNDTPELDSETP